MKIIRITHEQSQEDQIKENVISWLNNEINIIDQLKPHKKGLIDYAVNILGHSVMGGGLLIRLKNDQVIEKLNKQLQKCKTTFSNLIEYVNHIDSISLEDAQNRFPKSRHLSVGFYTIHPIDQKALCPLDNYYGRLSMDKDAELLELLGKMGAKKVYIEIEETNKHNHKSCILGESHGIDYATETAHNSNNESNNRKLFEFEGKRTKIPKDLLQHSLWFSRDSELNGIFESRIFSENRILRYEYVSTYSETFGFDFSVAAQYLGNSIDIKAQYEQLKNRKKIFIIEFA